MLRKNFLKYIFILVFFLLNIAAVNAVDFTLKIGDSSNPYVHQDEVYIPVIAEKISSYNFLKPFKLDFVYNHDIFNFKEFSCNLPFSKNNFLVKENDSSLTILSNFEKIINIPFQNRRFTIGNIVLSINDNSVGDEQTFDCFFTQNQFYNKTIKSSANLKLTSSHRENKPISNRSYLKPETIENQKCKTSGKLKNIIPNIGTLSPSFDPNIFEYSIDVGENVQYMEIDAVPQESDSTVKINRRKLLAAGKTTIIKITVSNKNGKTIYIVKVNRDAKSNSKSNDHKNTEKEKSSTGKRNRKHKSKKDKFGNDVDDDTDYDDDEDVENDDDETNSNNQIIKDENSSQVYLIVAIILTVLTIMGYYLYKFIKYKRNNSKNTENSLNKPSK